MGSPVIISLIVLKNTSSPTLPIIYIHVHVHVRTYTRILLNSTEEKEFDQKYVQYTISLFR